MDFSEEEERDRQMEQWRQAKLVSENEDKQQFLEFLAALENIGAAITDEEKEWYIIQITNGTRIR